MIEHNDKRYLIVRGIRYVVPYWHDQKYSVRLEDANRHLTVVQVLASRLGRPHVPPDQLETYFRRVLEEEGHVSIRRHQKKNNNRAVKRPKKNGNNQVDATNDDYLQVQDPDTIVGRNDILKIRNHVHERCTLDRGPLVTLQDIICDSTSSSYYRAIYKPAGLPVMNNEGLAYGCVAGMVGDSSSGYHLGHRLDLPVEGVLLLGKGKKRAAKLIKALSPSAKQQSGGGVLKAYLARVKGGATFSKQLVGNAVLQSDGMHEVRCFLRWDNRAKKAIVVASNDNENSAGDVKDHEKNSGSNKETITRIQQLEWDEVKKESLMRVELVTGARHQVRAVLASLGLPIKGDSTYGGGIDANETAEGNRRIVDVDGAPDTFADMKDVQQSTGTSTTSLSNEESGLLLYADDDQGRLLSMLTKHEVMGCDKCRWQIEETKKGGTIRGTEQLNDMICLLSYHYRIPSLDIDVRLPDDMLPEWAKTTATSTTISSTTG